MKPILVLGIGNLLLKDEGIGVRAVRALANMVELVVKEIDSILAGKK